MIFESSICKLLLSMAGSLLSLSGNKSKLLILTYHRVLDQVDPIMEGYIDKVSFDKQMQSLKSLFNIISLSTAVEYMRSGTLPNRAVCITFDDGYADNLHNALPVLKKYSIPATLFVSTGAINGGRMWNDTVIEAIRLCDKGELDLTDIEMGVFKIDDLHSRKLAVTRMLSELKYKDQQERELLVNKIADRINKDLPDNLMLTSEQIVEIRKAGVEIGGHTENHPILATLPAELAEREIVDNKNKLTEILNEEINTFAYPNGRPNLDYNAAHINMLKRAGYVLSVSTSWGFAQKGMDVYQLPRIGTVESTPWKLSKALLKTYLDKPTFVN